MTGEQTTAVDAESCHLCASRFWWRRAAKVRLDLCVEESDTLEEMQGHLSEERLVGTLSTAQSTHTALCQLR
jgi:hypothetical protein